MGRPMIPSPMNPIGPCMTSGGPGARPKTRPGHPAPVARQGKGDGGAPPRQGRGGGDEKTVSATIARGGKLRADAAGDNARLDGNAKAPVG